MIELRSNKTVIALLLASVSVFIYLDGIKITSK